MNKPTTKFTVVSDNKKAYYDFEIIEKVECGIVLLGCEVKSLRQGNITLRDAYAKVVNGELWMVGGHIAPYKQGGQFAAIDPIRSRKLLINKKELKRLIGKTEIKGLTIIPLRLYLKGNLYKLEVGLARSKKNYDKRQTMKEKELKRETERAVKHY